MNRAAPVFILTALVFAASCGPATKTTTTTITNTNAPNSGPNATPDAFAASRDLYTKDCKQCHGEKGEGGPVKLDDGTKLKVPSLREGHALRHPDADFLKQITKGGDGMPAFKDKLKPEEIDSLIRFIRTQFQGGQGATQ